MRLWELHKCERILKRKLFGLKLLAGAAMLTLFAAFIVAAGAVETGPVPTNAPNPQTAIWLCVGSVITIVICAKALLWEDAREKRLSMLLRHAKRMIRHKERELARCERRRKACA